MEDLMRKTSGRRVVPISCLRGVDYTQTQIEVRDAVRTRQLLHPTLEPARVGSILRLVPDTKALMELASIPAEASP